MDTTTTLRDLLLATLLLPAAPTAQSVQLLEDINTTPLRTLSSNPSEVVACGSRVYATADVRATRELHELDQASETSRRLGGSERVRRLTPAGTRLYFVGSLAGSAREALWFVDRCDGTGTPRAIAWFDSIGSVAAVGTRVFFAGRTSSRGSELWRYDPAGGISLVRDIRPGTASSIPQRFVAMGSILMFTADDGVHGRELWRSDGTFSGTSMVRDVRVGAGSSSPADLAVSFSDSASQWRLFFSANNFTEGREPWVSDGTDAGTAMISDLNPGFGRSSNPSIVAGPQGSAYFSAFAPATGRELYRSFGTQVLTFLVDIRPGTAGSNPTNLASLGSNVYFAADDGVRGAEPWRSNGTDRGTWIVGDVLPGPAGSSPTSLFAFRDRTLEYLSFVAETGSGRDLHVWREGSPLRALGLVGADPGQPAHISGNRIAFAADDVRLNRFGREVWTADTLRAEMLADVNDLPDGPETLDSFPGQGISFFGSSLFAATDDEHGRELWISDATGPGTRLVKDINPGARSSNPDLLTLVGGRVFFAANDGAGQRLFRTDGTAAGTVPVSPPGSLVWIAPLGERAFFSLHDASGGEELWVSDGTPAGTRRVRDIRPGLVSGRPRSPVRLGNRLCFTADDGVHGRELWISDGTAAGTSMVRDIQPNAGSSSPGSLTALGERIYFLADDGVRGYELWTSDGTAGGTSLVVEVGPGAAGVGPGLLTAIGDRIYWTPDDGARGSELWISDGTAAGTSLVADLTPGPAGTRFGGLAGVGERCFVFVVEGRLVRPWVTDGTPAGTRSLQTTFSGVEHWIPSGSRHLWFRAFTADGWQLWRSDGTDAGTARITSIGPPPPNRRLQLLGFVGGDLLFGADDPIKGNELFRIRYPRAEQPAMSRVVGQGRGAGNRVPSLRITDPVLGGVFTATVRNAVPGGSVWLLLSVGPTAATSLGSDYVAYFDFVNVGVLGPFPSPGSTWSLTLPAPNDIALRGLDLAWQAVTTPSAAPNGYELTNGVFTIHGR